MRILAVADEEAKYLYDYYTPGKLDDYDLILACGDLNSSYLEFLVTLAHCPVLYVHGNHDERYVQDPPGGCICIDDTIYVYQGVRILGLGGSFKYRDGTFMFTERQMRRRIRRLFFKLLYRRGFDILVTHCPARHINDTEFPAHRGFECFHRLLKKFKPKYFVHGHMHLNYGMNIPRRMNYEPNGGETTIINAYEYYAFDY